MPDSPSGGCLVCGAPVHWRGMCHTHGERWRRWGMPPLEEWAAALREGRLNTCEVCGRGWNGHRGAKTCSPECRRTRKARISLARWRALPPGEKRAATTQHAVRDRAKRHERLTLRACRVCGKEFTPARRDTDRCPDAACKLAAKQQHEQEFRTRRLVQRAARVAAQLKLEDDPHEQ